MLKNRKKQANIAGGIALINMFAIVAFASFYPVSHYPNVINVFTWIWFGSMGFGVVVLALGKGRSIFWGLCGFLFPICWIILMCLPDKHKDQ